MRNTNLINRGNYATGKYSTDSLAFSSEFSNESFENAYDGNHFRKNDVATRIDLISGMTRLEKIIDEINPDQKELELNIYELMSSARMDYITNLEKKLELEIDKLIRAKPEEFNSFRRFRTKSKFLSCISEFGHPPAYIIALNFDPESKHQNHRFGGDLDNTFHGKDFRLSGLQTHLKELGYKDGAILVKSDGIIYAVRAQITNVDPKAIFNGNKELDLNNPHIYGFKEPVNVRHFSALGASFHLNELITYTLSEETGNIRRFKNGKITFSTLQDEDPYPNHYVSYAL